MLEDPPLPTPMLLFAHLPIQIPILKGTTEVEESEEEEEDDEDASTTSLNVLQHDSNSVREALAKSKPINNVTCLVSTYFDHNETTSDFCLRLLLTILRAHDLYAPLSRLLSVLPVDGLPLSQAQCDHAYDLFLQFDRQENPFVLSHLHQLRNSLSHLKGDIQRVLCRCHSQICMFRHPTAGCAVISITVIVTL
ncbi:hypothetical protein LR48_Vigan11g128900 [Vigna angularis]|uniref:Uncharacterized protein n=1 Tax=Phaseolus angularis TaxID=3914 RepID=A0A0L9VT53_PHAAN|nr:hypothetical protein LR48_Vigan11g128900 [Vigna angularis]